MSELLQAALIPLMGTVAGSACVFFMRGGLNDTVRKVLSAFAAGIMTAASVWSLLIPALEQSAVLGRFAFVPAGLGLIVGILTLTLIDRFIVKLDKKRLTSKGTVREKASMLVLAVVIHNIPEGMAAGAIYAGLLSGDTSITLSAALALVIGISIQNFPEGAIISLPLRANGMKKRRAFLYGVYSGLAESAGAIATIMAAGLIVPILPFLLSFAAGAMLYVVIKELVPEFYAFPCGELCIPVFSLGFTIMMALDTALG